jgi:membrane-associated protein
MHTVQFLTNLVEHHQTLVYAIIFFGVLIEGEVVTISTGILAHLGALNIPLALLCIFLGGISKTFLGYSLGKFLFKRFNRNIFFTYMQKKVKNFLPRFKEKPFWSIFISKFILGANHVVILFSGFEQIDYKKYLKAEIISTIIWAPGMMALGYFFSYTALQVSKEIWRFSMVVLVLFLLFILFDKLISWLYEAFEELYDSHRKI